MFTSKQKKLTWDRRSIVKGESLLSIFRKLAIWNRVSISELINFLGQRERGQVRYEDDRAKVLNVERTCAFEISRV